MNGLEFLEKINDIDDELIDAAARKLTAPAVTVSRKPWIFLAVGAAIAAAIILLIVGLNSGWGRKPGGEGTAIVSVDESTKSTESETTTVKETATTKETTAETTSSQQATEEKTQSNINITTQENDDQEDWQEPDYSDNDDSEYEPEVDNNEPEPVQPEYRVITIEIAYAEDMDDDASTEELALFWEDSEHMYYMDTYILNSATVIYENGEFEDLVSALNNDHIDISDLDAFGVPYYTD